MTPHKQSPPRTGDTATTRLVRIESKLTRLMLRVGLDNEGNPTGDTVLVDRKVLDDAADAIDLYLTLLDNHHFTPEFEAQYAKAEAAFNQLVDARRGICPPKSP